MIPRSHRDVAAVDSSIHARFNGRSYKFSMQCQAQAPVEGQRQERCDLTLRSGSVAQLLFTYGTYYEGDARVWASEHLPAILWAGDLNADGRLDVLLDTSDHYNVRERQLYLSDNSVLVSQAAVHTTTGC
jgi:hypothetical protein